MIQLKLVSGRRSSTRLVPIKFEPAIDEIELGKANSKATQALSFAHEKAHLELNHTFTCGVYPGKWGTHNQHVLAEIEAWKQAVATAEPELKSKVMPYIKARLRGYIACLSKAELKRLTARLEEART